MLNKFGTFIVHLGFVMFAYIPHYKEPKNAKMNEMSFERQVGKAIAGEFFHIAKII